MVTLPRSPLLYAAFVAALLVACDSPLHREQHSVWSLPYEVVSARPDDAAPLDPDTPHPDASAELADAAGTTDHDEPGLTPADAGSRDADPADADPPDADPPDAGPLDADPPDAGPLHPTPAHPDHPIGHTVALTPSSLDPIRVAVISDMNGSYGSTTYGAAVHAAITAILADPPDLVLSTGDMVAGQKSGLDHRAMWAAFHAAVSDRLDAADIPFAIAPGNHDASGWPAFEAERALYREEWRKRWPDLDFVDPTHYPHRYSYTRGPGFFVAIDSTTTGPLDAAEMQWLDEQLTLGAAFPARIVYGHVPLYPVASPKQDEVIGDTKLEDLLRRHRVSAFITGHHHAYYPGRRADVRFVSMACLGNGPRTLLGHTETSKRSYLTFDVTADGLAPIVDLEAWAYPGFAQAIPRSSLPPAIGSGDRRIVRDDLPWP